jgi:hypothetical protein
MEHVYKNHRIEVSVRLDRNDRMVSVFIYYSEGPSNILVTFPTNEVFKTYDDAMESGLAVRRNGLTGDCPIPGTNPNNNRML